MPEIVGLEDWQRARLIPVAGIRGQEEQEMRATSAFLAVLSAVPAFSHSLLSDLGAPRGKVETFTEVRLQGGDGKVGRPDGAIIVTRGAKKWSALVEVKTGAGSLAEDQTNRYLDLARDHGFDTVLTISTRSLLDRRTRRSAWIDGSFVASSSSTYRGVAFSPQP
jgi:hypothetical protein